MYMGSSEDRVEIANLYAKEVGVHEFSDNRNVNSDAIDVSKIFDIKSSFTPDSKSKLFLGVDKLPVELLQERVKIAKSARVYTQLTSSESLVPCYSNEEYSCISLYKDKIILDAGVQRTYGALKSDSGTQLYIENIVRLLSSD